MVGTRTRLWIDDEYIYRRSILIVISNSQLYGGVVRIASDARLDDGLLDVNVFSGTGPASVVRTVAGVLTGLHGRDPRHSFYRGRTIRIESDKPIALHVDGEPFGTTPLDCEVVPRALPVLIPEHMRAGLFAGRMPSSRGLAGSGQVIGGQRLRSVGIAVKFQERELKWIVQIAVFTTRRSGTSAGGATRNCPNPSRTKSARMILRLAQRRMWIIVASCCWCGS